MNDLKWWDQFDWEWALARYQKDPDIDHESAMLQCGLAIRAIRPERDDLRARVAKLEAENGKQRAALAMHMRAAGWTDEELAQRVTDQAKRIAELEAENSRLKVRLEEIGDYAFERELRRD